VNTQVIPYSTIDTWIQKTRHFVYNSMLGKNEVSVQRERYGKKLLMIINVPQAVEWLKRKEKEEFSDRMKLI